MMKISELINEHGFKCLTQECDTDKEITTVSSCDLLSWVMAKGVEGQAWITVQTHTNIIAVASLLDMACIIIPEDIAVEDETIAKANMQDVPMLSSSLSSYDIFKIFYNEGY